MVRDPWSATIIPAAQRALRRLAVAPGVRVALVSGRTVEDLASRARIGGISYRGDHGAQRAETVRGFRRDAVRVEHEPVSREVAEVAELLKARVPVIVDEPALVLEDKGPALTFHFRAAADVDATRARVVAAVDSLDTERVMSGSGGRRAYELRPPAASTKGDALVELVEAYRPDAVFMFGDDANDALAFDALRELRSRGRIDGLAIAVAGHAEVTALVAPRADILLASPADAARVLGSMAEAARRRR
jgi:trehalose-phosphatase